MKTGMRATVDVQNSQRRGRARQPVAEAEAEAEAVRPGRFAWARDPWLWAVLVGCLIVVAALAVEVFQPLDRDEGAFLTIAQEILHGRVPYRDAFDHKSPAIYYLLAGVLFLTSHLSLLAQIVVVRLVVLVANVVTAAGLGVLGRHWWRLEVGILAALLWLFALPAFQGAQAFTEPFATAATVWAVAVAARAPGARGALGAGLLLAGATLFKQTALLALPGLVFIICYGLATSSGGMSFIARVGGRLGALGLGLAAPWLVVAGLFAWAGALQPMVQQVVYANLAYPADAPATIQVLLWRQIDALPLLLVTAPLVAGAGLLRWIGLTGWPQRMPSAGAIATTALAAANLLPFAAHAFRHYWLQVFPWLALLAALGILAVLDTWRAPATGQISPVSQPSQAGPWWRAVLAPALLVVLLLAGSNRSLFTIHLPGERAALQQQMNVGAWIAEHVSPGSRLLIAPAEPEYYYLADRLPAATFVYVLPVNRTSALIQQLTDALRAGQFDVVVWQTAPGRPYFAPAYAGLYQTLEARYNKVASYTAAGVEIYGAAGSGSG
jgi:hypothetical protein